jgi:hypothetical protein
MIGLAAILVALTITPSVKLRATPPPGFATVDAAAGSNASAAQYWSVAVHVTQWKYNRTSSLPEQVPSDFRLGETTGHLNVEDRATRAAYWSRLRAEWSKPENWHKAYHLDFDWIVQSAQSVSRVVKRLFDNT